MTRTNWLFWFVVVFTGIVLLIAVGKNVEPARTQEEGADMCMHRGLKSAKATKYLDGILFEATCLNGDRVTRTRDE